MLEFKKPECRLLGDILLVKHYFSLLWLVPSIELDDLCQEPEDLKEK